MALSVDQPMLLLITIASASIEYLHLIARLVRGNSYVIRMGNAEMRRFHGRLP